MAEWTDEMLTAIKKFKPLIYPLHIHLADVILSEENQTSKSAY